VAERQRAGASGTAITQALDGLDPQAVVQSVREAGALYRRWDRSARAQACAALARFCAQRWSLSSVPPIDVAARTERAQPEARPPSADRTEVLRRMAQGMERLGAELQELEAALRRMRGRARARGWRSWSRTAPPWTWGSSCSSSASSRRGTGLGAGAAEQADLER
jgi:hypothetical protein